MTRHALRILLLLALLLPAAALAGRQDDFDPYEDASERDSTRRGPVLGVARVSVADGDVRILSVSGDEEQARGGMPLTSGVVLVTGDDSRSEVQLDAGNFLRLGPSTEVRFLELGNRSFRVELLRGVASWSQYKRHEADAEIQTALGSVGALKPGLFTVEFRGVGQMDVTVRDGQVEVFADGRSQIVKKGVFTVRGEPDDVRMRASKAESKSSFEQWAARRDKMLDRGRGRGSSWLPLYLGVGYGWGRPGYGYYRPYYRPRTTVYVGTRVGSRRGRRH